jgi:hypothetical protein
LRFAIFPASQNRYPYALSNPTNLLDPSGQCVFGAPCPKPITHAGAYLRENGVEVGKKLDRLAFTIDRDTAIAVDSLTVGYCAIASSTVVDAPTCPAFYAAAVAAASPIIFTSNLISVGGTASGCVGSIANQKEGGASFHNIKNCGVAAAFSFGGLFVLDPNISTLLNGYIVCRDDGKCTIP